MVDRIRATTVFGKTLAPGLGKGKTFAYRDDLSRFDEFYDIHELQVEQEVKRFGDAVTCIVGELGALAEQIEKEMDSALSAVFKAHMAMVQDSVLKAEVEKEIEDELVSAGTAVRTVFRRWERRFRSMESSVAGQRADDVHDLARRIVFSLAGVRAHALEELPEGSVVVANRLLPSDTIVLARRKASAAVLEVGGAGSHAALFAQEMGLPCVAGLPGVVDAVPPGALCLVDADAGEVIVNPDPEHERAFQAKRERMEQTASKARVRAHEPATTKDGKAIAVFANVGRVEDTEAAVANGADGIGLYRMERVYLGRREPPDTAALLEEMRKTLAPARGLPVYVRLLDIGADKPLPFMETQREANPSLGLRGIRFLEAYPELLQTQLEALLLLASDFDVHVIVPMVTLEREVQGVKERWADAAFATGTAPLPRLGAMIETPAAALAASTIARHADFLSFGTNDLTQYTFAADRENAAVDAYFDDTHDVIFKLMKMVHDDAPHIPLSICGKLASRPESILRVLECGITSLSVVPPSIPIIKETIRQCGSR